MLINKAASYEYEITDSYEAGIELLGSEVKSLRLGKGSMKGGFVKVRDGEAYLHNVHIHPYEFSRDEEYEPTRIRRLLLHKKEILKLEQLDQKKGVSLIPLKIYGSGRRFKVRVGVGKGRKSHEKRRVLKLRDQERELRKQLKNVAIR
ncbi:SsrA-binding protein SmpB [Patescibacteria group bacterium]